MPTADGKTMFSTQVITTAPGMTNVGTFASGRTNALTK